MFSDEHFIWLGICVLLVGSLLYCSVHYRWRYKTAVYVMCGFAAVSEFVKIFTHIEPVSGGSWLGGGYMRAVSLPFHLCSIFIFVFFYLAIAKNERMVHILKAFFLPVGLAGATLALLMATSGTDFSQPYAYQCFVYHSAMLWFALYLIVTKQVEITWRDYLRNLLLLFGLAILMTWINGALITAGCTTVNFCFVIRPPADNLPFLNLNHGWHAYFAHLAFTGVVLETLVALPFLCKKKEKTTRSAAA